MPSRTDALRMTANALDKLYEPPKWIKRMGMNDRLNYIVRMYSETCGDNWYLWIETAIEGLPTLIYSLKAISKVDVIKEVLEQNYRCGLRQALGTGKKAPRTAFQKAKVLFWKLERVRGQLFWYWLIAEALTAYVMEWQSIVVEEQRCIEPPHAGPCILDSPISTLGGIVAEYAVSFGTREYDPSGWSGTGGTPTDIAPHASGAYNVGVSLGCMWSSPSVFTWHAIIRDGIGNIVATGPSVTGPSNIPSHGACFGIASAVTFNLADYKAYVVLEVGDPSALGHFTEGTFSVGIAQ